MDKACAKTAKNQGVKRGVTVALPSFFEIPH